VHRNLFTLLLTLCLPLALFGAKSVPYFKQLSNEAGLPSNTIYNLAINPENQLMFLGTKNGLYSYNGFVFNKIPIVGSRSNALTSILFDAQNRLWVRNFSNQLFYLENDTLRPYDLSSYFGFSTVVKEIYTANDSVYVCSLSEVVAVSINTFESDISVSKNNSVYVFHISENKTAWANFDFNVLELNNPSFRMALLGDNPSVEFHQNKYVVSYGDLKTPFYSIIDDQTTSEVRWFEHSSENIPKVNFTREINGNIWVCTRNGLFFRTDDSQPYKWIFKGIEITDVVQDYLKNIWVSTSSHGLFKIPSLDFQLVSEKLLFDVKNFVTTKKGFIVLTNQGKLYDYNKKEDKLTDLNPGVLIADIHYYYQEEEILVTDQAVLDLKNKKLEEVDFVRAYRPLNDSVNFLVNFVNLIKVRKPSSYKLNFNREKDPISVGRIRDVLYDEQRKNLIISSVEGVLVLDSNKVSTALKFDNGLVHALNCFLIHDKLYAFTLNQGVLIFNPNDFSFEKAINNPIDLPEIEIYKVVESSNYLLALSKNYIYKFSKSDYSIIKIPFRNILGDIDINYVNFNDSGDMILGTYNGLVRLDSESINKNLIEPYFFIEEFKIGNKKFDVDNQIFGFSENNLFLRLNPVYYNKYGSTLSYKLERNNELITPNQEALNLFQPEIKYNALPPGKYLLTINYADFNENTFSKTFYFAIKKPFWSTPLFFVLIFTLLMSAFFYVIKWQQKKFARKQKQKELLVNSQLTAMRSQMNPHFLYNVLNSLQGLIYGEKIIEAGEYTNKFSTYLRKTLILSDRLEITVAQEIEFLTTYLDLEKLRFGEDFKFKILVEPDVDDTILLPAVLVQPYVENAIKHGLLNKLSEKELLVSFKQKENILTITVDDNGIGRKNANEINAKKKNKYSSFSTEANAQRVALLNQNSSSKISVEIIDKTNSDNQPCGTRVVITIKTNVR
jgi:ligand-binding sensor domain-containing protein